MDSYLKTRVIAGATLISFLATACTTLDPYTASSISICFYYFFLFSLLRNSSPV